MRAEQTAELLALLEVIAINTAVIAGQTQKAAPLDDDELLQCQVEVRRTVQQLTGAGYTVQ